MPGVKGDELVSIVKASHPDVRCIMVSGQVDEDLIAKTKAGAHLDAFVRKPWQSKVLIDSVLACVDGPGRAGGS